MFIPLDHIYTYLQSQMHPDVLAYRFYPHGSKSITDLDQKPQNLWDHRDKYPGLAVRNNFDYKTSTPVIFHDQEILDHDRYCKLTLDEAEFVCTKWYPTRWKAMSEPMRLKYKDRVRNYNIFVMRDHYLADKWILVHSEKNSTELEKYQSIGAIGVYWWSHAMISRDWYRFAMHDKRLDYRTDEMIYDFLIFSRAWTGTREYRLKFLELLVENNLIGKSNIRFSPRDNGLYYKHHVFHRPEFKINVDLDHLPANLSSSSASADYDALSYSLSAVEIVLETIFEQSPQHLTEKTLRPLACGKPFILLSAPGSLQYLRDYGFQTFDPIIDESYDLIENPLDRLAGAIQAMKKISSLDDNRRRRVFAELHEIAQQNQKWFWDEKFAVRLLQEFYDNYLPAYEISRRSQTGYGWADSRKFLFQLDPNRGAELLVNSPGSTNRQEIINIWRHCHAMRNNL